MGGYSQREGVYCHMVEKVLCWLLHTCAAISEFSDFIYYSHSHFLEFLPLPSVCAREEHLCLLFGFRIFSQLKQVEKVELKKNFHIFIFIL